MKKHGASIVAMAFVSLSAVVIGQDVARDQNSTNQNWTNYVRISAWSLNRNDAEKIVREAG
jgi:hypothetical protein